MRRKLLFVVVLVVFSMISTACQYSYIIASPEEGRVVSTTTVQISGSLTEGALVLGQQGGELKVAGVVTPVNPDGTWAATVDINTSQLINVIEVSYYDNYLHMEFVHKMAVISGPSLTDGQASSNGVGLHFTNTGLASLGPVIESMASNAFDINDALQGQGQLINTTVDTGFPLGTLTVTGSAYDAGMGNVGFATQSTAAGMNTTITINDLFIGLTLNIQTIGTCKIEINVPTATVNANFNLEPAPGDPSSVDVNMVGSPNVNLPTVNHEFISGPCDPDTFLIGGIISDLAGAEIPSAVHGAFVDMMGDPDGSGPQDSIIADAVEEALAGINIAGEVGAAIGVNLAAPIQAITETSQGMTLRSNADFFATVGNGPTDCPGVPDAPTINTTYDNPGSFPSLGTTAPNGQAYGIGMIISSSAFNQMLEAMAECGAFNSSISEVDLGGGPIALNAGFLSLIDPAFAKWDPTTPFRIDVVPSGAPFITNDAGPSGEMATLMIPSIELRFVGDFSAYEGWGDFEVLRVNIDAKLGLDMAFDAENNQLVPTITPGPADSVSSRVTNDWAGVNAPAIEQIFTALFPTFASSLGSSFSAFPLPSFLGLKLSVVQVVRNGNYWVLYSNLAPEPTTQLTNITLSNTSTAAFQEDASLFNSWSWRHSARKTQTKTSINTHFRASVAADACCQTGFPVFGSDSDAEGNGRYKVTFDVDAVPGETWRLDFAHNFRGFHTHIDEGDGGAFSEMRVPSGFSAHVVGRYRKNGGAWVDFSFNVSPSSNSSDSADALITGSRSTFATGTGDAHYEVEYYLRFYAKSDSVTFGSGDEAAIRAGLSDPLTNGVTAGDYPGVNNRNPSLDGHFSTITLTVI